MDINPEEFDGRRRLASEVCRLREDVNLLMQRVAALEAIVLKEPEAEDDDSNGTFPIQRDVHELD